MTPVLIVAIVFSFVALMVKMNLDFKRTQLIDRGSGGHDGLRTSELKALIREAVEEANRPLLERLDDLDARLETTRQLEQEDAPRLLKGSERPPQAS
jgi:hypothetical protein